MFPAKYRLTHDRDFTTLFKEGVMIHGDHVSLKIWNIIPEKFPRRAYTKDLLRIACVVGVKIDKRAVVRNKVKRQLREIVRPLLVEQKIRPGFLLAIIAKPKAVNEDFKILTESVQRTLSKARLLV